MNSPHPEPAVPAAESHTPHKPQGLMRTFRALGYSIEGFRAALRHEPSFREDLLFAAVLTPFAVVLPVNAVSTALMIASLFLIIIVELLNSAIEWTINYISTEKHAMAKRAKDMASAAVFLSYLNCIAVWVIIILANWHRIAELEFIRSPPKLLP